MSCRRRLEERGFLREVPWSGFVPLVELLECLRLMRRRTLGDTMPASVSEVVYAEEVACLVWR